MSGYEPSMGTSVLLLRKTSTASKMALWVKVLVAKPDSCVGSWDAS